MDPAHLLKCSVTMTAVLVLIFTSGLTSPAPSRLPTRASKAFLSQMRLEITSSLRDLADTEQLSGDSCSSLNLTELAGLEEQPLSSQNLSLIHCHVMQLSAVTTELEDHLQKIGQYCDTAARHMAGGDINHSNCSLPHFEQDEDSFCFVRCLLELLDRIFSKTTF